MYLYVDAGYFRRVMQDRLGAFLRTDVQPNWIAVKEGFRASRVFFYDCVDDVRRDGEKEDDFASRVQAAEAALDAVAALDGYFVRRGSLRGDGKRRRQKEVDVLLAVDMLSHSHRRNTSHVTLLAGDLDFKPLVEAVVEQGTVVVVACDARGSRDLARAADSQRLLTLGMLWEMSTGVWSQGSNFPQGWARVPPARLVQATGSIGQLRLIEVSQVGEDWCFDLDRFNMWQGAHSTDKYRAYAHKDLEMLLQFIEADFGAIVWDGGKRPAASRQIKASDLE